MKKYFLSCVMLLTGSIGIPYAQTKVIRVQAVAVQQYKKPSMPNREYKEVDEAVQQLTKAMIDADSVQLYALTYPNLKYAHSTGKVQNQQEFVEGITSGRSDFVTIDLSDQTVDIVGNTACVRHILDAKTNDSNVAGHVRLAILLVWVKEKGKWRLLARQAVKPQS